MGFLKPVTSRIANSLPAQVIGALGVVIGLVFHMGNLVDIGTGIMIGGLVCSPETRVAANKPA